MVATNVNISDVAIITTLIILVALGEFHWRQVALITEKVGNLLVPSHKSFFGYSCINQNTFSAVGILMEGACTQQRKVTNIILGHHIDRLP